MYIYLLVNPLFHPIHMKLRSLYIYQTWTVTSLTFLLQGADVFHTRHLQSIFSLHIIHYLFSPYTSFTIYFLPTHHSQSIFSLHIIHMLFSPYTSFTIYFLPTHHSQSIFSLHIIHNLFSPYTSFTIDFLPTHHSQSIFSLHIIHMLFSPYRGPWDCGFSTQCTTYRKWR